MEQYNSIQQLLKIEGGEKYPVFPPTVIQAVFDAKTGASLESILAQFNSVYLQYQGSPKATRLIIPVEMRRAGLTITYMNMEGETITERANSAVQKDNDNWGLDINWSRVDELSLSGDIAVSAQGTWMINGKDTGVKAVGPKGEAGITPWLKTIDNRLHVSYDNVNWEPCSDPITPYFRWYDNKIQISYDNKTWADLSGTFADNLYIKGYVATTSALPSGAAQGDIYGVGPTYAAEDTAHTNPIYRYYVRNAGTWVDNGAFTSIAAGIVQETGDSENVVMSQKAVTEKLSELGSEVDDVAIILQLSTTRQAIHGESQSGYINKDSGKLFLINTDKSVYYVPCEKGDIFEVTIPKTSNFGSVVGFSDEIKSDYELLAHNIDNIQNDILYQGRIKSEYSGYFIIAYMTDSGTPTVVKVISESRTIEELKDVQGDIVEQGTDVAEAIKVEAVRYSLSERKYVTETTYVSKRNIPINLAKTDYIYSSKTGVPNNQNMFAFFDRDKNLIGGVVNNSGAYIKETKLRSYVPSDLWDVIKYISINCYTTSATSANLTLKTETVFTEDTDNANSIVYDYIAGKPINVDVKKTVHGSITVEFVKVDLTKKINVVSSGFFNVYAPDNGIVFYDSLKRIVKEVKSSNIEYIFNNSELDTKIGVCLNDYVDEEDTKKISYVSVTTYDNGKDVSSSFINIFYLNDVFVKTNKITPYTGKKLLTYGDSVTEGATWQNQLAEMKGLDWSLYDTVRANESLECTSDVYHYEVASGIDATKVCFKRDDGSYYYFSDEGNEIDVNMSSMVSVHNRCTGVSGSMLIARPQDGIDYRCVYKRIQEAQSFNPDVILIYGTYNDASMNIGGSDENNIRYYGTPTDVPYYGLPKSNVTFSSSLKGIFEMLARTCPMAKVVYIGIYTYCNNPSGEEEWNKHMKTCAYQNGIAKEICALYGIPFIDLQKNFGCTWYNHMKFMANSSPHPNEYGADRTAEIIAANI